MLQEGTSSLDANTALELALSHHCCLHSSWLSECLAQDKCVYSGEFRCRGQMSGDAWERNLSVSGEWKEFTRSEDPHTQRQEA